MTDRPPRLPFALTVGVTGHRLGALPVERRGAVDQAIRDALALIEQEARALHKRMKPSDTFDEGEPAFTIVSPLADGADQIAAEAALDRGWQLEAALPFSREEYARDFIDEDPSQTFGDLLARASCVLELPGDRADEPAAYAMAGRATVAHCDILIALWDGKPPRGRGGTAEVVQAALSAGHPVIHVPVEDEPVNLLWSGFDPHVLTRGGHEKAIRRRFGKAHVAQILESVIAPPSDPVERRQYAQFLKERGHRVRPRIEYPLMLMLAGVKRMRTSAWQESKCTEAINEEWRKFDEECHAPGKINAPLELLGGAYRWSDRLAGYYAQNFRSGHVFNFVSAASAAIVGFSAFMFPTHQFGLAAFEFLIVIAIIANTMFGVRHEWRRRWLDYRQLAERLRPMRSLKLIGIAAPDVQGSHTDPVPHRWVDWYAAAVWRAMGVPNGHIEPHETAPMVRAITCHEIESQIAYNEGAATQSEKLDRRLGRFGGALFIGTAITTAVIMLGYYFDPEWAEETGDWTTLISSGLPAIGAAIFGIQYQGDFAGSAQRARSTAQALSAISADLEQDQDRLDRAADLFEEASRAMLADLDEWRLVNKRVELEVQ